MQMLPPPTPPPSSPPSSTTTTTTLPQSSSAPKSMNSDYVGISALSTQIESLEKRLTPILGNANRDTNVERKKPKQTPSERKQL
jgi:hypothetical protein